MRKTGIFVNAKETLSGYNYLIKYLAQPIRHDLKFVTTLLDLGIDVNSRMKGSNSTALFFAARSSADCAIVEAILENGGDVNQRTSSGRTLIW
jgi:ankyrin repeat protein